MSAVCHAWVDESIHVTATAPLYVLAAVVADPDACDPIRGDLRSLVRRPRRRLHRRDEEGPDRLRAVSAVAGADVTLVGGVGSPLDPKRQERARRKCLERLFFQFGGEP